VLRDDFRPDSDIDVLVKFDPGERMGLFRLARTEEELTTLLGRKTDLNTIGTLSLCFLDEVLAEAGAFTVQVLDQRPMQRLDVFERKLLAR